MLECDDLIVREISADLNMYSFFKYFAHRRQDCYGLINVCIAAITFREQRWHFSKFRKRRKGVGFRRSIKQSSKADTNY